MKSLRFEVFGRHLLVVEAEEGWSTFYLGTEGKRRPAIDIVLPPDIPEPDIKQYLSDLCHEWATEQHPKVKLLD